MRILSELTITVLVQRVSLGFTGWMLFCYVIMHIRTYILQFCLAKFLHANNIWGNFPTLTEKVLVYQDCFLHCISHDQGCLSGQAFEFYPGYVSNKLVYHNWAVNESSFWHCITVVYRNKSLIFIGLCFRMSSSFIIAIKLILLYLCAVHDRRPWH